MPALFGFLCGIMYLGLAVFIFTENLLIVFLGSMGIIAMTLGIVIHFEQVIEEAVKKAKEKRG